MNRASWLFAAGAALVAAASLPRLYSEERPDDARVIREQLPGYPLKVCVVGGEELGKMGEPVNHVYEGRLVRFCCRNCLKTFAQNPAKYMEMIDDAYRSAGVEPPAGSAGHDAGHVAGAPVAGPEVNAPPRSALAATPPPKPVPPPTASKREPKKPMWYCPMHPAYTSDHPADCPICNMKMELLEDDDTAEESAVPGYATVRIPVMRQQLIGVTWGRSSTRPVHKTIRAAGRVDVNERSLRAVNLRYGGWIERLVVSATGDAVRRGDPLFEIYSPDVLEAQRNYLLALDAASTGSKGAAEDLLQAARDRLLLWGFGEEDIKALDPKAPLPPRVIVRAPADGVVLKRTAVQGSSVEAGRDLYEIADLSTVWVHADVFEYEIPEVKAGMDATVRLSALPGETVAGKVIYVYPTLNEGTRTARVRIEVPNADGKLKPGMYAQVSLAADLGPQVVVEEDAVFDTGERQLVFVSGPGDRIVPREVTMGTRTDGLAVVLKGLRGGEKVVTGANFLIDSESRLKGQRLQSGKVAQGAAGEKPAAPAAPAHEGHAH